MKSITLHTLQWLDHLILQWILLFYAQYSDWIIALFAINSIALHKLQRLDYRMFCNEFNYYTNIAVIGLSHFLQRSLLLYTHSSDWIVAFLLWIPLLYAHCSDWTIACFAMNSIVLLISQYLDYHMFAVNSIIVIVAIMISIDLHSKSNAFLTVCGFRTVFSKSCGIQYFARRWGQNTKRNATQRLSSDMRICPQAHAGLPIATPDVHCNDLPPGGVPCCLSSVRSTPSCS